MDYFKKNLKVIKENHLYLYEELQEFFGEEITDLENIDEKKIKEEIELEYARANNGEAVLFLQKGNDIYRFNSAFNPSYEAARWVEQFDANRYYSIIELFGLGTGTFARELIQRFSEDTVIMVYEPSVKILIHTLYFCDLSDIFACKNVCITIGTNELTNYRDVLRSILGWNTIAYQLLVTTPFYTEVFPYEYKLMLEKIKKVSSDVRLDMNTVQILSKSANINIVSNMQYLVGNYQFSKIKDVIPTEMPVILVAAGPSLDKNIELLKQVKGRALIVAVDRALNSLFEHGITPDLSCTIDANKSLANYENPISEEVPLLCIPEANRKILDKHKGKKLFVIPNGFTRKVVDRLDLEQDELVIGGSVATAAFGALTAVGFKNIILIGQDLCIYGNHTHAFAAEKGNELIIPDDEDRIKVKANDGGIVETRHDFKFYIDWYVEHIQALEEGYTVINATEGGALIEGTKVMTLQEAIDGYCTKEYDIKALIDSIPKITEDKQQVLDIVEEMIEQLTNMKKYSKEAVNLCYDLIQNAVQGNCQNSKAKRLGSKLSELNEKVLDMDSYELVDGIVSANLGSKLNDIYAKTDNVYDDTRKTYDYSKYLYESMLPVIDQVKEQFETTRDNIKNQ